MDRRTLLRGGGASIALPLLECMAREPKRPTPARCVFVYFPNGANMRTWQITEVGEGYSLPIALRALEEHRADLTPISGLHHPSGIGSAHDCDRLWLSGKPRSMSVDQRIAEVTGLHTREASIEIAIAGGTLAWSRDGVPLPAQGNPRLVFDRLFRAPRGGVGARRRQLKRRGSILDAVLGRARVLRQRVGTSDRVKLDEYLAAIRDVEVRTERATSWLDVPRPRTSEETQRRFARDVPTTAAGDYYRSVFDLIVLALRTDMTRVATCMLGSEARSLALTEIGIRQSRHELSHDGGIQQKQERLTRCDAFLVGHFARFLGQMRAIDEQGESLLDRTIVVFGSGMSYGHNHGNANLPALVAGGRGLGMRHGRHIDYNVPKRGPYDLAKERDFYSLCLQPADPNARMSNLLLAILQRFDPRARSFADSTGVISELVG